MGLDDDLVGHWSSSLFDYGAMESSDLAFLPDGRGWTACANAAGGLSVTRFRWHCPMPGRLVLRESWMISGTWASLTKDWTFASIEESEPCEGTVSTAYVLRMETPHTGEPPVMAVRFEEAVEFCHVYAQGAREVRLDQDPSSGHVPYS